MLSFQLATSQEKDKILALMQKIYPTYRYNAAFFEWEYLQNPVGKAKTFIAKEGDKIIGKYSLTPHLLIENKQHYHIWRIQNVMIDPDYRKQGIFFQLMSYAHDAQHWTNQDVFWGFPNEKSFPYFEKYGFEIPHSYIFWAHEGNICESKQNSKYVIEEEFNFSFLTNELLLSLYENAGNYLNIVKDKNYLTWRYIDKKDTKYEIYTLIENEAIIGYFVLKKYINADNQTSLHICELKIKADKQTAIAFCLAFCIEKKVSYEAKILNTFLIFPDMQAILENLGFVKQETGRKIIFWKGLCENEAIQHKIYFSLGDNDIF